MQKLTWDLLKSGDSSSVSYNEQLIVRGECEIAGSKELIEKEGYSIKEPACKRLLIADLPEGSFRCLHPGARFPHFHCEHCDGQCFFGAFDFLRWIIREIRSGRSTEELMPMVEDVKTHLTMRHLHMDLNDLMKGP